MFQELFSSFSLEQIIVFLFMVAIVFKEGIELFEYFKNLINKKSKEINLQEEGIKKIIVDIEEIKKNIDQFKESHEKHTEQLEILIGSDIEDIRAFIIAKHHLHVEEKHWIDDYTMDVLEKRYKYYKEEGGNSYGERLMNEIRALPKHPPYEKKKE